MFFLTIDRLAGHTKAVKQQLWGPRAQQIYREFVPTEAKRYGRTIWNSNIRSIGLQEHLKGRFERASKDATPIVLNVPKESGDSQQDAQRMRTQHRGAVGDGTSEYKSAEPKRLYAARGLLGDQVKQPESFVLIPNFARQEFRNVSNNCNLVWEDCEFFYVSLKKFNPKNACVIMHSYFFAEMPLGNSFPFFNQH